MKTLTIYANESLFRYPDLYKFHLIDYSELPLLKVFKREGTTGEETLVACFNKWEYFVIE